VGEVRFGSKADKASCLDFVRFTPESGQIAAVSIAATPANHSTEIYCFGSSAEAVAMYFE
jgi:hypothetical protein